MMMQLKPNNFSADKQWMDSELQVTMQGVFFSVHAGDLFRFVTVRSFVEVSKYLLTLPGVSGQYILSECFSQDPLEKNFSQLRARGGCCDNLTVQACMDATQSIRIQKSLALQPVCGNSSRKRRIFNTKRSLMKAPSPNERGRSTKIIYEWYLLRQQKFL